MKQYNPKDDLPYSKSRPLANNILTPSHVRGKVDLQYKRGNMVTKQEGDMILT